MVSLHDAGEQGRLLLLYLPGAGFGLTIRVGRGDRFPHLVRMGDISYLQYRFESFEPYNLFNSPILQHFIPPGGHGAAFQRSLYRLGRSGP